MKTTHISLPVLFQKEFLALIKESAISVRCIGKDQEDHIVVWVLYSDEKQPLIDKINADTKLINQFIKEASLVCEKFLLSFCAEIGEIIKRLGLNQKFNVDKLSKN